FLEVMQDGGLVRIDKQKDHVDVYILNLERVEKYIMWLHEETSKTEDKQLQISDKAMVILNAIQEFGGLPAGAASGEHTVNMEEVFQKLATARNVKFPFEWSTYEEIVRAGL